MQKQIPDCCEYPVSRAIAEVHQCSHMFTLAPDIWGQAVVNWVLAYLEIQATNAGIQSVELHQNVAMGNEAKEVYLSFNASSAN